MLVLNHRLVSCSQSVRAGVGRDTVIQHWTFVSFLQPGEERRGAAPGRDIDLMFPPCYPEQPAASRR